MVLALFRTLEFKKLFYRYLYYKYWRFFLVLPKTILNHLTIDLLLYYLYCLCKFLKDRFFYDCCSFQKADAKVRTLKHIFQIIPEVFFYFSFLSSSLLSKGRKKKNALRLHRLCQNVKLSLLSFSKADAKVHDLSIRAKHIYHFFTLKMKLFCNTLIDKGVVEHNFLKCYEKVSSLV